LWFRAIQKPDNASVAFRAELELPAKCPRYAPGDIECYLSETIYNPEDPNTWADALEQSRRSYSARLPEDALGHARSRISEARIQLALVLNREEYWFGDENVAGRTELVPSDRAAIDEIAALLREAQSEEGGQSAENQADAALLLSSIMLARGDLTSTISYFEEATSLMLDMELAALGPICWTFAHHLLRYGWVQRSYEMAGRAFAFAMRNSDFLLATRSRELMKKLESTYPGVFQ
jgi:hypothetical protein